MAYDSVNDTLLIQTADTVEQFTTEPSAVEGSLQTVLTFAVTPANFVELDSESDELTVLPYNSTAVETSDIQSPILYGTNDFYFIDVDPEFTIGVKKTHLAIARESVENGPLQTTVEFAVTPANFIDLDQDSEELIVLPYNSTAVQNEPFADETLFVTNSFAFVPLDPKSTLGVSTGGGGGGTGGSTRIQYWT